MDGTSALVAIATAILIAVPATIAAVASIRGNRKTEQAVANTQPNGGTSAHDQLMQRIDGWGMTLERQIRDASDNASAADEAAKAAVVAAKRADSVLGVIARDVSSTAHKLDAHLTTSDEYRNQLQVILTEEGGKLRAELDELKRKVADDGPV